MATLPPGMTAKDIGDWSAALGYAIGVLQGLADTAELDERTTMCLDEAAEGLHKIDLTRLIRD